MTGLRSFLDYLIYFCAFAVIGIGALGAYDAISYPGEASLEGEAAPGPLQILPEPFPDKHYVAVLIIGADDREDRGRSDTMMLLFLNPRRSHAALLSIPRDLRVHIPGRGLDKINHSYFFGGVDLTKRTIEKVFDLHIDYYAKADFNGFKEIVDMLGGVDIEVPDIEGRGRGMNYDDRADGLHIHLKPGLQHLDGEQAIGFVRFRQSKVHARTISDLKRAEHQQQFLRAMAEQKLKIANIHKLVPVAHKALDCIETDLGLREAMDLARALNKLSSDNLLAPSIPVRDTKIKGISYVQAGERDLRRVIREIYTHLDSVPARPCPIEVLNGSGKPGAAAAAGGMLSAQGFEVTDTGNADSFDYERTLIQYPKDRQNTARMVKRIIGCGEPVEHEGPPPEGEAAKIRVIVGSDLKERGHGE